MALLTDAELAELLPDESDTEDIVAMKFNDLIRLIQSKVNNLDSDNITDGTLTPEKFSNGAVTEDQVANDGTPEKIVQINSLGNLILQGKLSFVRE